MYQIIAIFRGTSTSRGPLDSNPLIVTGEELIAVDG